MCVNYAVQADAARALCAEIVTAGGRAIAAAADVADAEAVQAMVSRTQAELGPVTILVNNAGIAWQGTLDTHGGRWRMDYIGTASQARRNSGPKSIDDMRGSRE